MKTPLLSILLSVFLSSTYVHPTSSAPALASSQKEFHIEVTDCLTIAEKIWKNECGGKQDALTSWNQGEDFASLGIGHFIWHPSEENKVFKQTFPALLTFMKNHRVTVPKWLINTPDCPWNSREAFYHDFHSQNMHELRQFLFTTREWQALFMAERLQKSLPVLLASTPKEKQKHVTEVFQKLFKTPNGLYVLIDYLNFKGEGTATRETYQGKGWGLLQVLLEIPEQSADPIKDFIKGAKAVLTRRVTNAPSERNEQRWLKGWFNRIDTYQL